MRYFVLKSWILLFIIQYASANLSAQLEWYKKGEVYLYEVKTGFEFENYGIHSMTYYKDIKLNGHNLKILRYTDKIGQNKDIFIQQLGEKVSEYNNNSNEFRLMFDFAAKSGDPAPLSGFRIDSTGTIMIHNILRKTQVCKRENYRVLVIEGIGMVGDPAFSYQNVCSPPIPFFRCSGIVDGWDYYFRCFGIKNEYFDPYIECCDGLTKKEVCIHLIPNPTSETFTIKSNQFFDNYTIYDSTGKLVFKKDLLQTYADDCNINLPSSLYYVTLWFGTSHVSTKKLIIQSTP
ncbi:MAG: T9SS type A sorting domain-containing protein [Saprospiraceae bacterium]|nr:T9SS type A sorting domain-containing protein [Saprospiraceae bacterium]